MRALSILEILAHSSHGCNRKMLLPLYTTLIGAIPDYGSLIYGLAPSSQLKLLDPIQNSALRFVTGACRTSPAPNSSADTGIPPLHYRHPHSQLNSSPPFFSTRRLPPLITSSTLHTTFTPITISKPTSNVN